MDTIKIAIVGASGRMGNMLLEAVLADKKACLVAAIDQPGLPSVGRDVGELVGERPCGIAVSSNVEEGIAKADCVIDFTRPEGTLQHIDICVRQKKPLVIGTTGFDDEGKQLILEASQEIPVVFSPNMSVGVNLVFKLLKVATKVLSEGYDVEIVEAHHRLKVDSPSGTALRMGEVVAEALGRNLKECAIFGREGVIGVRDDQVIGFSTVRGGDIVGDHTVMYCGQGERVEVSHKASSRKPYAQGALLAAHFLSGKTKGLFDMQDVLGIK